MEGKSRHLRRSCEICSLNKESKHITYEDGIALYVCDRCAKEIITRPRPKVKKKSNLWVIPFLGGIAFAIIVAFYGFHVCLAGDPTGFFVFGSSPLFVVMGGITALIVNGVVNRG